MIFLIEQTNRQGDVLLKVEKRINLTRIGQTILKTVQKTIIIKKNSIDNKVDIPKWKSLSSILTDRFNPIWTHTGLRRSRDGTI